MMALLFALAGNTVFYTIAAFALVLLVLYGLSLMSKIETSVRGNRLGAVAMLLAVLLTLSYYDIFSVAELWIAMLIGTLIGLFLARKVKMIQMPQMVGLLNGFGGLASMIAGILTLLDSSASLTAFSQITAGLAIVVGGLTWLGSAIAAAKLHKLLPQKPRVLPGHSLWTQLFLVASLVSALLFAFPAFQAGKPMNLWLILLAVLFSHLFAYFFAIRVGGADMPITISLLNSFSGVAGSIAGMAVGDVLLVAVGGIVGASGLLLTQIMCRAMNRHLGDILTGKTSMPSKPTPEKEKAPAENAMAEEAAISAESEAKSGSGKVEAGSDMTPVEKAAAALASAKRIILVPGYGMALSQAQPLVKQLLDEMEAEGKDLQFAIHPVAGRMPGHMNVLLAEVDVPYEKLHEMKEIDGEFKDADLAIVIGANDVINPAANTAEGTPIYGMPVLSVADCPHVLILNFDLKPGYAGVENPLYQEAAENGDHVQILLGDAKDSLRSLMKAYHQQAAEKTEETEKADVANEEAAQDPITAASNWLASAKRIILVPGYGMALSQAQPLVKQLLDEMEAEGKDLQFAIHPVAGRMPGHMNVLLAEVDVPYEKLHEMKEIDGEFKDADLAIVIGANDVINPAANTAEGTPIYGMPVLSVADCPHVLILNFDLKPGYAGVENPLYQEAAENGDHVQILLGDAKDSLRSLLETCRRV